MNALDSAELTLRCLEGVYVSFLDFKIEKIKCYPGWEGRGGEEVYPDEDSITSSRFFELSPMPIDYEPRRSEHPFFNSGYTLLTRLIHLQAPISKSIVKAPSELTHNPELTVKIAEYVYRRFVGNDKQVLLRLNSIAEIKCWRRIGETVDIGGEVFGDMDNCVVKRIHETVKRAVKDVGEGEGGRWMGREREEDLMTRPSSV